MTAKFAKIIWIYGMSGVGKTTLSRKLSQDLGFLCADSDQVRSMKWVKPDFTPKGRRDYQRELRSEIETLQLADTDGVVVASITPYDDMRIKNRQVFEPDYYEVLLKCDLDTLIKRDPKGLYKKALSGEIDNFTGVSDPFQEGSPDLIIDTGKLSQEDSYYILLEKVKRWINERNFMEGRKTG